MLNTILGFLEVVTLILSFYFTNKCRENKKESDELLKDIKEKKFFKTYLDDQPS